MAVWPLAMNDAGGWASLGVVPVLIGPLQALLAILPYIAVALFTTVVSILKPRVMWNFLKALWRLKLQVGLVVACTTGLVWGGRVLWPSGGGSAGAARGGQDWPLFRGEPARRGAPAGEMGPTRGGVRWARQKGEEWFYSSPAVVGNRVYVASAQLSAFDSKDGSGAIYCFDANSGALAWRSSPTFATGCKTYRATFSSPVIKGNRLVCGEGLHWAQKARVVCLDTADGKMVWSHETASHVECTPVIAAVRIKDPRTGRDKDEDRVFVGAGDDGYYCFDLATGALRWHLPGENYPDAETSLIVHDNKVYAGLGNGGKALCVIDAAAGRELKRVPTPYPVFSPPAIADGKLYVGMGNGDFIASGNPPAGEVWCIDLARLDAHAGGPFQPDWKVAVGDTVLGAVAVAGERIYFCSVDGLLHCADRRSGRKLAEWAAHASIKASPAVTDRHVYVVTSKGMLYGLDGRTLELVWEYKVGSAPECISSPAVAGGHVYVGTQEDGFVCVGEPGGATVPVWPGRLAGPARGGNYFGSPPPRLGEFKWQYPPDQEGKTEAAYVDAPPAAMGEGLFVPLADGPVRGVACLPLRGAGETAPKPTWLYKTPNGVHLSPAVVGEKVLLVDGKAGDPGRHLHIVNIKDGNGLKKVPLAGGASGVFAATGEAVFVQDAPAALGCYDLSGGRLWSQSVGGRMVRGPAVAQAMVVAATVEPPAMVALDRPTGRPLWWAPLEARPVTMPLIHKDIVYIGTERALEAHSLVDGQPLGTEKFKPACGGVSGDFVADSTRLFFVNTRGELVGLRREDGGAAFDPVGGARVGSVPLVGQDTVLFESADGKIMSVHVDVEGDLRKAREALAAGAATSQPGEAARESELVKLRVALRKLKATEWCDTSWLGTPASPMVLAGASIYVGRAGWGLVRLGEAK